MTDDSSTQPPSEYSILLPCTPDTFANFVSRLLGSSQTIERRFRGNFELTRADVENTFHLVHQRVQQQNAASLIEFTVKILYDDGSSVLLNNMTDFTHYIEVRPIISTGVFLTWVYLIQFQNKTTPERQQIDLSIHAGHEEVEGEDGEVIIRPSIFRRGHCALRIAHTARTWGVDIESLLSGHLASLFIKESPLKHFIYRHSGKIGFGAGLSAFFLVIIGVYWGVERFAAQQLNAANTALGADLATKLNFVIEKYAQGPWTRFNMLMLMFVLVAIFGSILLGAWVGSTADNRPSSFVLLSKKAEEDRDKALRKRTRDWYIFTLSLVTSFVLGIASNWAFSMLVRLIS